MPLADSYQRIADIAKKQLRIEDHSDEALTRKAAALQRLIRESTSHIDYNRYSEAFAHLYWTRNYWKAMYFFEYEYTHKQFVRCDAPGRAALRVLSLGAGSAADTLAAMTWLNKHLPTSSTASITLVDKSSKQIDLAQLIISAAVTELTNVQWNISYVCSAVESWQSSEEPFDLIIMSHLLTENPERVSALCSTAITYLADAGDILVIERERDAVWRHAIDCFSNAALSVYDTRISAEKRALLETHLDTDDSAFTPHYVRVTAPRLRYQSDLILRYFSAWKQQSLEMLSEVFTEDATYDEKPGIEQVIEGLSGIREYWSKYPLQQKIYTFTSEMFSTRTMFLCVRLKDHSIPQNNTLISVVQSTFILTPTQKRYVNLLNTLVPKKPHLPDDLSLRQGYNS